MSDNFLLPLAAESPGAAAARQAEAYLQQARQAVQGGAEWPAPALAAPVHRLAVVGAGTMGLGIALCALAAGLSVRWLERSPQALERGVQRLRDSLEQAVQRGRLSASARDERLARLHPTTEVGAVGDVDAAIEAVFEDVAVKQEVMAQLHAVCPAHALFISNTSTLDIDALAQGCGREAQVLGMHFLTPAHVTPLVEVVRGRATSDATLATARALAQALGKLPVLAGNAWGFIGNRMFEGYLREVDALQLEGTPAERIDRALEAFGFALGPCRTLDMAGTDLVSQVLAARAQRFPHPPAYRRVTRRLAELGRFGHKSARGHYLYEGRIARADPDLTRVCAEEALALGIAQKPCASDEEIVARCVRPLIQEGQALLAEGMACRASDIDLVWVLGYGFPAVRGGPMHLAAALAA
jgi:3-hydroxyacyl-CoA dehydrogenase